MRNGISSILSCETDSDPIPMSACHACPVDTGVTDELRNKCLPEIFIKSVYSSNAMKDTCPKMDLVI